MKNKTYCKNKQLIDLLEEIINISDQSSINYYLRAGSLLGAVRHQDLIPWDNDIDIEIPITQYFKLYTELDNNLPESMKVFWYKDDVNYSRLFMRVGFMNKDHNSLHIDVFPMIGLVNSRRGNFHIKKINLLSRIYKTKKYKFKELYSYSKLLSMPLYFLKVLIIPIPSSLIQKITEKELKRYKIDSCNYVVNPFSKYGKDSIFPKKWYQNEIIVPFNRLKVRIPGEFDLILTKLYGDYHIERKE